MIEIISIFVLMLVIFLILFWLKKTLFLFGFFFKLFLLFLLVCVVGSVLFGYFIIKDANDFKNNFGNSTSMVILKNTDNVTNTEKFLAGVKFNPEDKEFGSLTKKELADTEKLYKEDKISTLGSEYYKVFIIELKSFDEVNLYNISDQNVQLTKDEMKNVMLSDNAREELAEIISKKTGDNVKDILNELSATDEGVKGYIFSHYLTTVFDPTNMGVFLSQLKSDNIRVYANTALFKAVKLIPKSLIDMMIKD